MHEVLCFRVNWRTAKGRNVSQNKVSLLCADEIKREREFYRMRGLPCPKDIPPNAGEVEEDKAAPDQHAESDYHRQDEQVS
jgi:hypothetical protein